ncbi:hypothetical protein GCM10010515_65110 [Streptomyces fructofermentans]|uniref:Uncharacterized protein n=1 Tax=Streptomyces fructofermentans TaxID=152141 RepID=A0A918NQW7_9ACTN|nr:hypothetical protein GCM10010515_65110 [Streptomyces fructofermentans]
MRGSTAGRFVHGLRVGGREPCGTDSDYRAGVGAGTLPGRRAETLRDGLGARRRVRMYGDALRVRAGEPRRTPCGSV